MLLPQCEFKHIKCSLLVFMKVPFVPVLNSRLLEYCGENNACVGAERKNEVADIADTLKKLHLYPVATSGKSEQCLSIQIFVLNCSLMSKTRLLNDCV